MSFGNLFTPSEDKKVRSLFWPSVVGRLGFLYHETKTCRNGAADFLAAKFRMQPNYTISFRTPSKSIEWQPTPIV